MTDEADVPLAPIGLLKVFLVSNGFPLRCSEADRPGAWLRLPPFVDRLAAAALDVSRISELGPVKVGAL
jgi:hypothetical protein